jgi:hypothetical protein
MWQHRPSNLKNINHLKYFTPKNATKNKKSFNPLDEAVAVSFCVLSVP